MLSVLGMTYSDQDRRDTIKYRLLAPSKDIGSWGHEYMRHLALEIGEEQQHRVNDETSGQEPNLDDIKELGLSLVPYFLKHNAEADAVDLLSELEMITDIPQYLDEDTYSRVCLYMVRYVLCLLRRLTGSDVQQHGATPPLSRQPRIPQDRIQHLHTVQTVYTGSPPRYSAE